MHDILVAPFCGMVDAFLERALEVRHRLRATSEPHLRTEVISTSLTCPTVVTRHTNLERHPVTNLEAADSVADGYHHSSGLMPQ